MIRNDAQLLIEQESELQFWFLELPLATRRRVSEHVLRNEQMASTGMSEEQIEKRNRELMGHRLRAWMQKERDRCKRIEKKRSMERAMA